MHFLFTTPSGAALGRGFHGTNLWFRGRSHVERTLLRGGMKIWLLLSKEKTLSMNDICIVFYITDTRVLDFCNSKEKIRREKTESAHGLPSAVTVQCSVAGMS